MSRPKRIIKTPQEIERNFQHAFQALEISSKAYDDGFRGEAARLAGTIYLFVHDHGRKALSLLTLVNRKNIPFRNTARALDPNNMLTEAPLTFMRLTTCGVGQKPNFQYMPLLTEDPEQTNQRDLGFSAWWEAGVLRDNKRQIFSRKNLVFQMRHGEGGGHVSGHIDEAFVDLQRNNSSGWFAIGPGGPLVPEYAPHYASIRQIAYELRETLLKNCSDLVALS